MFRVGFLPHHRHRASFRSSSFCQFCVRCYRLPAIFLHYFGHRPFEERQLLEHPVWLRLFLQLAFNRSDVFIPRRAILNEVIVHGCFFGLSSVIHGSFLAHCVFLWFWYDYRFMAQRSTA